MSSQGVERFVNTKFKENDREKSKKDIEHVYVV